MSTQKLITILEERLQISPNNRRLKEKLAGLFLYQGEDSKAEKLYTEVLKEKPDSKKQATSPSTGLILLVSN